MANTDLVMFPLPTGSTLLVEIYPFGSDTETGHYTPVEATNRKGLFTVSLAGVEPGLYSIHVYRVGAVNQLIAGDWVRISDEMPQTVVGFTSQISDEILADISSSIHGVGTIRWDVEVKDSNGAPIPGVETWVTTDAAGNNAIGNSQFTDDFGAASFWLNAGTYYLWRRHARYQFTNPQTMEVTA